MLHRFSQISGLKLNVTKTEVLWFGSLSGKTDIFFPERKLKWTTNKVKALGTYFSTKAEEAWKQNFQEKIEKIRKLTENWSFRRLSLLGKVTVIKNLLASQLVYILTPLPTCHMAIKEINDLLCKFLWDGKGDKIKRTVVINDYQEGGIKMLDIKSFNSALKATWIPKYLDVNNKGKWKIVFKYWLSRIQKENIFTYNLSRKDAQAINVDDNFLQELIEIWAEVNFQGKLRSLKEFEEQTLWHNSLIRIENMPVFYNQWFNKDIYKVSHLLEEKNDRFLSHKDFQNKYKLQVPYLQYFGLIACVSKLRKSIKLEPNDVKQEKQTIHSTTSKMSSKLFYDTLIRKTGTTPKTSQEKWARDVEIVNIEEMQWETIYMRDFNCTKSTKLRNFQFKLLHRRIVTNSFLHKIGIKNRNNCTFCEVERETLFHLFWCCRIVQSFWKILENWLIKYKILPETKSIDKLTALGLKVNMRQR